MCINNEDKGQDDIAFRMRSDLNRIEETCAKYLGTVIPWQPLNSIKKQDKWNYYLDKSRKMGWCFNPKVCS